MLRQSEAYILHIFYELKTRLKAIHKRKLWDLLTHKTFQRENAAAIVSQVSEVFPNTGPKDLQTTWNWDPGLEWV